MSRRDPLWFAALKLLLWVAGLLLFFRAMTHFFAFLGGDLRDFWMLIAGASTVFIVFWGLLLWRWRLLGNAGNEQAVLPAIAAGMNDENAIAVIKETTTMPDKPHIYIDKVLTVNHGTINQNAPGGTMNLAPVTYNQTFETRQATGETAQGEPQDEAAGTLGVDEAIDIKGLAEYSAKLKPPGVCANTVRKILNDADIQPCAAERDGRTTRNLYPRVESQNAVSEYMTKKR